MRRMKLQVRLSGRITILLGLLLIVLSGFGQRRDTTATGVHLSVQGQPVILPFELPDGVCVGNELALPVPVVDWRGDSLGCGWLFGGVAITLPYVVQEGDLDKMLEFWALNSCSNPLPPIVITGGAITAPAAPIYTNVPFTVASSTAATVSEGSVTYSWTVNGATVSDATDVSLNYTAFTAGTYKFIRKATATTDYRTVATAMATVNVLMDPDGTPGGGCTDGDGNKYPTVIIGDQEWMAENLKVASKVGCGNSWDNGTYGRLYDWPAAMNCAPSSATNPSNVQGLCSSGWHLPSDAEWTQLSDYLIAKFPGIGDGTVLKSKTGWNDSGNGTDNVNFCGLPGGNCESNGDKLYQGRSGYWWSSAEGGSNDAWYRHLMNYDTEALYGYYAKSSGRSIRCVKNTGGDPVTVSGGSITAPSGTVYAGNLFTIGSGTAATASVGGVTYSWTVNEVAVSGATGDTLNYTASAAGTYAFVRKATSVADNGKSANATVSVTVKSPPIIFGGLKWAGEDAPGDAAYDWDQAMAYCAGIGMRLPTQAEIVSLPKNNGMSVVAYRVYWSVTESNSDNAYRWYWGGSGWIWSDSIKGDSLRVRCVE